MGPYLENLRKALSRFFRELVRWWSNNAITSKLRIGLEIHAKHMNAKSQLDRNHILEIIRRMKYVENQ